MFETLVYFEPFHKLGHAHKDWTPKSASGQSSFPTRQWEVHFSFILFSSFCEGLWVINSDGDIHYVNIYISVFFFFLISKDSPSKINKEKLFPVNILLKTVILRTRHQCKGKILSKLQIYEHFPTGLLWKDVIVWVEKNHLCPSPHTKKNSYHWKCEVVCSVTWRKDDM